jgi:pimeloyl-ACP methyl ester carboxylesterase
VLLRAIQGNVEVNRSLGREGKDLACEGGRALREHFVDRHAEPSGPGDDRRWNMSRCSLLRTRALTARLLSLCTAAGFASSATDALAQPFNVRSWYAQGQVFVVWQFPAAPASTSTVEIYSSAAAQVNVANMTRLGKLFFPEYTGGRLKALSAAARLQVPTPGDGTYRLAADEGVFVYTPRAAGNLFFAAVDAGSAVVNAGNSAAAAFNYDPVNDPVRPHPQFTFNTAGGNPATAMVVWADGRDDFNNARPDIPVLADADKNGVPHAFVITGPTVPLPTGPVPALFVMHGGGNEYQLFLPGVPSRSNMSLGLNNGIVVTPDDSYYAIIDNNLLLTDTSWFGYTPEMDPFIVGARNPPADTATVVNFTQRRVHWILDWLLSPRSPFTIDPQRVAMVGHSGGGRGTSHLTRLRPERFSAAVCYTPASDLTQESLGRENYLRGDWEQNLVTNVIGPNGPVHVTDLYTSTTRLSPTQRDFPLTRFYYGKRDQKDAATWSPAQRSVVDALNDSRMGYLISWDERDHGVEKWDTEENDATDGNAGPWPDIGQWIAPVRTARPSGQNIVNTYRANASYPGFYNVDHDPSLALRQPDPGPGDPNLGDPYGTWGGYLEWDSATLIDEPRRWAATLFATGLSAVSIDNAPQAQYTTDLIPRKTSNFNPPPGTQFTWTVRDAATNVILQSGVTTAEADGVVAVPGVVVPRDPARVRLTIELLCPCSADFDQSGGTPDSSDIDAFFSAWLLGDATADADCSGGTPDASDIDTFFQEWLAGGC